MKTIVLILLVTGAGCVIAWNVATKRQLARDTEQLAGRQATWDKERSDLEATLNKAANRHPEQSVSAPEATAPSSTTPTPREIIERLKIAQPGKSSRNSRIVIAQLENLIAAGTNALPAIREFLMQNLDVAYDSDGLGRSKGSRVQMEFVVPPSLRFGLFDAARQIGGPDAERLLAEVLATTGRAVEVAFLATILQELAPDKYRETALAAARDLLSHSTASTDPANKHDRDYLYGILTMYNDASLVSLSEAQLIQADGQVDRAALKYLQKSLGEQALPLAAAAYNDSRVDPAKREPLARVGLYYAGLNPQANQLFDAAVRDESLSPEVRRNFIEDLNQDGFANEKHPTPEDQKIVEARLKLIDSYADQIKDPKLRAGFAEAQKDLLKMQAKAAATPAQ